jgi:hypothetical protein
LGLEISADGLRRLARVLDPDSLTDPLAHSEAVDPELRDLFRFHEPARIVPPAADPSPGTWRWFGPPAAYAAPVETELTDIVRRLDRWVPDDDELHEYRDAVARLLSAVADATAKREDLSARLWEPYPNIVRTTAWQESCWRQFVKRDGKITYLQSRSGDVGIMQVNRRVWRGFFDLHKLQWDIAYNAGAGAEILAQLMVRYGASSGDERTEDVVRATYSAYNGGPDAYRRYRRARVSPKLRAIDEAFWTKYQAMAAGRALDLVLCIEGWPAPRPAQLSTAPVDSTPNRSMSSRRSRATLRRPSRHSAIASRPRASLV